MTSGENSKPEVGSTQSKTKLILCFDGTGNTFSGSDADTNVVKILRKLDRNHPNQYHYYQTGIGTYGVNETSVNKGIIGSIGSNISMTLDSGFGTTFDAHVMAGYRFLMRYYEKDAKIYMFGFSRGAFTAKFLARMINKVGLLCKGNEEMVPFAYALYQRYLQGEITERERAQAKPNLCDNEVEADGEAEVNGDSNGISNGISDTHSQTNLVPDSSTAQATTITREDSMLASNTPIDTENIQLRENEIEAFSQTFCRKDDEGKNIKVFFLGMWDCVASVAVLERKAPIPVAVTGTANHVRHAVAIDERRVKFKAALLAQDIKNDIKTTLKKMNEDGHKNTSKHTELEDIKEVWFPGNHSDVGGGWPAVAPEPEGEKGGFGQYVRNFFASFFSSKPAKASSNLDHDRFQMSDIPLEWMIREVEAVGEHNPEAAVHWCHSKEIFKKGLKERRKQAQEGFMHDCLSFGYGSSFFQVLMWKFMEFCPGISRWELNDRTTENKLQGWEPRRWTPNQGSYRDIPRGAVLHQSLLDRLMRYQKEYKPQNNHGDGTDHCLATGDAVTIYDKEPQDPSDPCFVGKELAKFRIHERVEVTKDLHTGEWVTARVPEKAKIEEDEEHAHHQTYDFNHYVLELEKKEEGRV